MKKLNYLVLLFLLVITFSCDKREDFFAESNLPPVLEINALNTPSSYIKDFTSAESITDSFNLVNNDYLINFRITDESKDVKIEYFIDNGATITLVSTSNNTTKETQEITGVIKAVPQNVGLHTIDIVVTDPYNKTKRISVQLNVYLRNAVPILKISTSSNIGSNNTTLIDVNLIDTFSYAQGNIILDYYILDDNAAYNLSFNSTNLGSVSENLSVKNIVSQPYSVIVTGQLILSPTQLGMHDITIKVTDDLLQLKELHAFIYITDIPAELEVSSSLNSFSTNSSYVSSFSEKYLFELGEYRIRYKIVDDSPNPIFSFSSSSSASMVEDLSSKTSITISGITTIEGVVRLIPVGAAVHNVQLKVTEPGGIITSNNIIDIRNNQAPYTNVNINKSGSPVSNLISVIATGYSDPDITLFQDAVIKFDFEVYKNGVLFSTSLNQTGNSYQTYAATGTANYYGRVRAYDKYGKVSSWATSVIISVSN